MTSAPGWTLPTKPTAVTSPHPGPQARSTASPLNFNPEQPEGQRTPQATSLSACPGEGSDVELWPRGVRPPRWGSLSVLGNMLNFAGPRFPTWKNEDSTQGPTPVPPGQPRLPVFTAGGPLHHLPSIEGNRHFVTCRGSAGDKHQVLQEHFTHLDIHEPTGEGTKSQN